MTDFQDISFLDGLKKLINVDENGANELIERADVDQLNELANAVSTGDKRKALMIYYALKDKKVAESVNNLNVGDIVYLDNGEGKKKARVLIPSAPGDTVGVMIGGNDTVKMVGRNKISLEEDSVSGVLGMTMLPGLARMQALAGLAPSEDCVTVEVVDDPEYDDHMTCALNALEALEGVLPEIPLKDLKILRARIAQLMTMMNESAPAPKARKRKE